MLSPKKRNKWSKCNQNKLILNVDWASSFCRELLLRSQTDSYLLNSLQLGRSRIRRKAIAGLVGGGLQPPSLEQFTR